MFIYVSCNCYFCYHIFIISLVDCNNEFCGWWMIIIYLFLVLIIVEVVGIIKRKALIKDLAAVYHAECLAYCQQLLELQTKWEEVTCKCTLLSLSLFSAITLFWLILEANKLLTFFSCLRKRVMLDKHPLDSHHLPYVVICELW